MPSVFLQFEFPGSTAWVYTAGALAVAVFFHFGRLLTLRNLDLLLLGLFSPGFLLIEDAGRNGSGGEKLAGYAWLLTASAVWFARCLLDGWVVRRPRVITNLSTAGMFWLGGAVLVGLTAAAAGRPTGERVGKPAVVLSGVEEVGAAVAERVQPDPPPPDAVRAWVSRGLALACQVAVVALLVLVCLRHFADARTAAAAALLYLLLPPTAFAFDQSHHVWPTALTLGAVLAYRRPAAAGLLLGLAAGTSVFPLVLFPAWWQFYHGRGGGRFGVWFVVAAAGAASLVGGVWLGGGGPLGVLSPEHLADWQPWVKPAAESIWTGGRWYYRLPVFVAYAGLVLAGFAWPKARNLGQLLAVNAAAVLGLQFWFADHGGQYVLWYAPLLILMMLRPTCTQLVPPSAAGSPLFGWLRRTRPPAGVPSPGLAV